jgi:glutathione S-transferase
MEPAMELYFAYPSTYSQKVLLGLYEKNVDFKPHLIDLTSDEERAGYREFYPLGKVPLLLRGDGRMIPESSIILDYIDQAFPQGPTLIPADQELARQVRLIDRMCDLYLNDPVVSLILESWKPAPEQNLEMMEKAIEKIGIMYRFLGDHLENGQFLVGDSFTLADCSAIPPLYFAKAFADFSSIGNLQGYWDRMSQRPAFVRLQKEAAPHVRALMGE